VTAQGLSPETSDARRRRPGLTRSAISEGANVGYLAARENAKDERGAETDEARGRRQLGIKAHAGGHHHPSKTGVNRSCMTHAAGQVRRNGISPD
jgi:hypothetical protein